jgi:hypothetical protein
MVSAQPPLLVPSPAVQQAPVNQTGVKQHSFREASVERLENILTVSKLQTTSLQPNINKVLGTGFMRSLILKSVMTTSANAAATAYTEGGIFDSIGQVLLHDTNGDLVNLSRGQHWRYLDLYFGANQYPPIGDAAVSASYATQLQYASNDTNIVQAVSGSGSTGGSFTFWLELPVAINDRDLRCLVGNQDQAQTYDFRADYNASGQVYSTPPTTLGTLVQTLYYMSRTVPSPYNPDGSQNIPKPNTYGMLHYWLESTDPQLPTPGQVVHRMQRLGQTMRGFVVVLRQGSATLGRANAEGAMPTSIQIKIGDQTLFTEDTSARRYLMRRRYGFDAPDGCLVWDNTHDFRGYQSNGELGDDWIYTQDITQYQVIATYPSGFTASASNLLTYLTDDMSIPAGIDPMNV